MARIAVVLISSVFALQSWAQTRDGDYQVVSVRNFVIDGPKLAARHAKVRLIGSYILRGNVGALYTDTQAVMMAKYSNAGTQPSVVLLTDDASHELRATFLSCDSNPATGQSGCQVEIRGRATMCETSNAFGATSHAPCLDVEDGGYWSPPPPTPEQIQANKAAEETDRAEQARQAAVMQQAMEEKYRECLKNTRMYQGTPMDYLIETECGRPPQIVAPSAPPAARVPAPSSAPPAGTINDLTPVRNIDAHAADHIAYTCHQSAQGDSQREMLCRGQEMHAWQRLVQNNEFPTITQVIINKCQQPPFPDTFVAREACARYELGEASMP